MLRLNFEVILTHYEDGWITAECPNLSGCVSQGKTEAKAVDNIREAITGWLWAEGLKASEFPAKPHA